MNCLSDCKDSTPGLWTTQDIQIVAGFDDSSSEKRTASEYGVVFWKVQPSDIVQKFIRHDANYARLVQNVCFGRVVEIVTHMDGALPGVDR